MLAGWLSYVKELRTKKGDLMAFATLEDEEATVELVVFPRVWQETKDAWALNSLLLIRGKVDAGDQEKKIIVDIATKVSPETIRQTLEATMSHSPSSPNFPQPTNLVSTNGGITINLAELTYDVQTRLRTLLASRPGTRRVYLQVPHMGKTRTIETSFTIEYDEDIMKAIEDVCGEGSVIDAHPDLHGESQKSKVKSQNYGIPTESGWNT
jgi:DNA polymerase-3 subunit alpha